MIFAPTLRRASFVHAPHNHDAALQRFLLAAAQGSPARAPVQVQDDEKATTLQLDVPGLAREQLTITIEGAQVQLKSIDGAPRQVQRSWELPGEIDASASSAKLENGVLTLVLAKLQPESRATQLAIG
ncbi:MAG: Hsp20 family protein [Simplicispira suum]|jgi:HSP20 family molecular chaperone IbpA|uniref:Hsp20/alpha crystallin family protein n=1 Tax=Simplicispira suum TaxID=2109915 RepID=UPI001C6BFB1A|nr:Hsp20/alpha crystallin family protein [Simplicispira suum]MBW7833283.1 Hsp20 family protein [Simplicispira suum]MCO5104612.1 Hsp20/alpha crystallin family protein [Burkholderiaceae bacterium]